MNEKNVAAKPNRLKWKRRGFIALFLAWPTLHFIVFYVLINANSILMAFQQTKAGSSETYWTMENFTRLFREGFNGVEPIMKEALKNTLTFFFFGLLVMTPLNLFNGYLFYKKIPCYKVFRFVFYLPAIIPTTVLTTLFRYILSPDSSGLVSIILGNFNVAMPDLLGDSRYAMKTMLLYQFWTGLTAFLLSSNAMKRIPHEVIESAELDGITDIQELTSIIIPLIWPTIATSLLLSVVNIFSATGPVLLLTEGNAGTYTIAYWLFERVMSRTNLEYAAATGLFYTVLGLPIILFTKWLSGKVEDVEY